MDGTDHPQEVLNPYIALADMCLNLVLVLAFCVAAVSAVGRAGEGEGPYKRLQEEFERAVKRELPRDLAPQWYQGKNDPPGVQRWIFLDEKYLFEPGSCALTPRGGYKLARFARVLGEYYRAHRRPWRRIRIEGHTRPPQGGAADDWKPSSTRAAMVARVIHGRGHIPAYYLAVAGRAGQNPVNKQNPDDSRNERIEILLEYARKPPEDWISGGPSAGQDGRNTAR